MAVIFLLSFQGSYSTVTAHTAQSDVAPDHCSTPTERLYVVGHTTEDGFTYDMDEYKVKKNTCYKLYFENEDTTEHDLNIDAVPGMMDKVHIHIAGSSSDNNIKSMNIKTPNTDAEFEIYCSIGLHRSLGMEAKLIVGEGNPDLLSFGYAVPIIIIVGLPIIAPTLFRKFQ